MINYTTTQLECKSLEVGHPVDIIFHIRPQLERTLSQMIDLLLYSDIFTILRCNRKILQLLEWFFVVLNTLCSFLLTAIECSTVPVTDGLNWLFNEGQKKESYELIQYLTTNCDRFISINYQKYFL